LFLPLYSCYGVGIYRGWVASSGDAS